LTLDDLGGLRAEDLIQNKFKRVEVAYDAQPADNKSVLFACIYAFKWLYLRSVMTQLLQCGVDVFQPFIIKEIVRLLTSKDFEKDSNEEVVKWAFFLIACRFFKYLVDEHDFMHNLKTGLMAMKCIRSMIFKK